MQIAVSRRVLRSTVLALGVVVLAGCSMFSSKNPRYDPQPLTEYAAGVSASPAWSVSIGSGGGRSEGRRAGKECVSTCRSRWWPCHHKKNKRTHRKPLQLAGADTTGRRER